jgi:predicted nicotinamide N-methyase
MADRVVCVVLGILPLRLRIALPTEDDTMLTSWTGAQVWPCSLCLADWLARSELDLRGKRVLELACGAAPLPSAVIALLHDVAEVVASDVDRTALRFAEMNLRQWGSGQRLRVQRLEFSESLRTVERGRYDMILFADPITSVDGAAALAACIEHCLADGAGAAVFGVIPDVRVGAQELCTAMQRHGLAADELDLGQCATSYITAVEALRAAALKTPSRPARAGLCAGSDVLLRAPMMKVADLRAIFATPWAWRRLL